mgnify:CR=1 FL=1
MKKFSKFLAVFSCFVMVLSFVAFAADSPSTSDNSGTQTGAQSPDTGDNSGARTDDVYAIPATEMSAGVTAPKVAFGGKELNVTVAAASVADVANAKAQAQAYFGESATVLKVFDVSLPAGDYSAGVDVTMNVPGVLAGQSISVIHWNGQYWENLAVTNVSDGSVTATFTSFSPVAVIVNPSVAAPSTGYNAPVAVIILAVVCAAGAAYCLRRREVIK